ncbi:uncharacterized protein LOC127245083 [Andrographis paniculata]|uniref:uncharacterized protein LOC127245083 n=1 Tax=Andrographis paniculata TaxID=175694 RepID=UPI0021E891A4|nr:uncharacterized protein LOC127245083 [Andrographis paniculata]XP_051121684.1 uncharacterized protein LOC127245083 [Andrographis paniculata]
MKKLFFFRSHSSNTANNNQRSPPSTDKQVYWERPPEKVKSAKIKHSSEDLIHGSTPCLRRSLSFSSGTLHDTGKSSLNNGDLLGSPCSTGHKHSGHQSYRFRSLTPERQSRKKLLDASMVGSGLRVEKFGSTVSREQSDLSEVSSYCSSNVSNKVLDRYIDGEQQEERCVVAKANSKSNSQFEKGNATLNRPPRLHFPAPASHGSRKQKPKSQSFRETKLPPPQFSSNDGDDNKYCPESPRELAKHVVERLSQSRFLPKMRSKELDHGSPITIEDVYGGSLIRHSDAYTDDISPKDCTGDWRTETSDGSHQEEISEYLRNMSFFGNKERADEENGDAAMDTDLELFKKSKEAEVRVSILTEELGGEKFLQFRGLSTPALIQTIKSLTEEKLNMAMEVSAVLEDRIADNALFREKLKHERKELDAQTRKFEKERNEMQLLLEKELDRRSTEWSTKLEKYQTEEHRLRERVRELAEQNVCLQREISSFSEMEEDARSRITNSKEKFDDLSIQFKEANEENRYLQETLSEVQGKLRSAEEDRDYIERNYKEKVAECKDLHQSITRLQRTRKDQEKTIEGLQSFCEELGKKNLKENPDFEVKLQVELKRSTAVEHGLRKELDSCRVQVDTLRSENIYLLDRLKSCGKEGAFSTFKLDQEINNRISFLQNQTHPLLSESSLLCRRLLEYAKTNGGFQPNKGQISASCFDGHEVVECEVKLQGLERAAENLKVSLQTISNVLQEKSDLLPQEHNSGGMDSQKSISNDDLKKQHELRSEDMIKSELKAETLLTSLLREKLYSKEQDLEQLQAEIAAAIRCNDILKCKVQNAVDDCSCLNHKMKELELKMIKKDETINQLQYELQDCKKELSIVRGVLEKVSEERDMMWEEVKQHTEKNMLLNAEINMLRKKIESLDEDILVKEGQISILKDSISKPLDLLASPDPDNFCWTATR